MNMTAAGERLFLSQSAVSQAIAEMERHYGVKLFERFSKKLYLTAAGTRLLGYARHIIRINADVESEMKALGERGNIRIGASVTVCSYILPRLVSGFNTKFTDTSISVVENNTNEVEKMLLADDIDIGVVEGDVSSDDIISNEFMEDELVLICPNQHRFNGFDIITPKELEKERFIVREAGSGTRKTFEDVMSANRLSYKTVWTCNNSDTIKLAVENGIGISFISKLAIERERTLGLLSVKRVSGLEFKRSFKIIYHKNKYLTNRLRSFVGFCIESAKQPR